MPWSWRGASRCRLKSFERKAEKTRSTAPRRCVQFLMVTSENRRIEYRGDENEKKEKTSLGARARWRSDYRGGPKRSAGNERTERREWKSDIYELSLTGFHIFFLGETVLRIDSKRSSRCSRLPFAELLLFFSRMIVDRISRNDRIWCIRNDIRLRVWWDNSRTGRFEKSMIGCYSYRSM